MKGTKLILAAALICCSIWLVSCDIERVNDTPEAISVPADSPYIPMAGDTIRCDDGSDYIILDADAYPDSDPLPSAPKELTLPEGEALRYKDGSGDYLFMQNTYETLRMAYTLCAGANVSDVKLSVPEDVIADAFSEWDPERVAAFADAGEGDTDCVEAWDMFKNGVYYKTLYEIGVQHGEAGNE